MANFAGSKLTLGPSGISRWPILKSFDKMFLSWVLSAPCEHLGLYLRFNTRSLLLNCWLLISQCDDSFPFRQIIKSCHNKTFFCVYFALTCQCWYKKLDTTLLSFINPKCQGLKSLEVLGWILGWAAVGVCAAHSRLPSSLTVLWEAAWVGEH